MLLTVLTGDIVGSSALSAKQLDAAMTALGALPNAFGGATETVPSLFSRRGGDGWQLTLNTAPQALRATLLAQATVTAQGISTRIAVATGTGTLPDGAAPDLNAAHGPAFQASGRLLAGMKAHQRFAHAEGGALHAAFCLADQLSQSWTVAQARALCLVLPPDAGPRRAAAEQLGISRQAVDQALHGAGYPGLAAAIDALEEPSS